MKSIHGQLFWWACNYCVCFSKSILFYCISLQLWNTKAGWGSRPDTYIGNGHTDDITGLKFSSDGLILVSRSFDGSLKVQCLILTNLFIVLSLSCLEDLPKIILVSCLDLGLASNKRVSLCVWWSSKSLCPDKYCIQPRRTTYLNWNICRKRKHNRGAAMHFGQGEITTGL